jgi:hypothetical protein
MRGSNSSGGHGTSGGNGGGNGSGQHGEDEEEDKKVQFSQPTLVTSVMMRWPVVPNYIKVDYTARARQQRLGRKERKIL